MGVDATRKGLFRCLSEAFAAIGLRHGHGSQRATGWCTTAEGSSGSSWPAYRAARLG